MSSQVNLIGHEQKSKFLSLPRIQVSSRFLRGNESLQDRNQVKQGESVGDSQVRFAWKLAEAHDKEKTIDPTDLSVPVMLKAVYTFDVWLIVCLIGPPINTNINTATVMHYKDI